nr:nucleotide-binding, alpha-beta plait [Tanacetum cinerariifolium]
MDGDETHDAYLNRAYEYADVLAAIGEPVKDKDLVMLAVSCLHEEYNGLKTTISARQSPTAFSELHTLLGDHDYMLGKTRAPDPSITSSFAANYHLETRVNSHVTPDLEAMDNSEAYYGDNAHSPQKTYSPSHHGYRCLDISIKRLYIARHIRFNEAQFPFDIPKTISPPPLKTSPYYSSKSPYVISTTDHPSPPSPRSPISSPSLVSHLIPSSQTSPKSSNGQPSLVSTTSTPTPPPPTPPPLPITRQRLANLLQNPKQQRQAMKEEYDVLIKNGTWSLVPHALNTNVVDCKWVYRLKWDKNGAITHYKARFVAKGFRQQPGNNKGTIDNIICQIGSTFALKDLRPVNYLLGIKIVPYVSGILLSQKKYILELLQSDGLSNCNPVSSPMITSSSLYLDDSTAFCNLINIDK